MGSPVLNCPTAQEHDLHPAGGSVEKGMSIPFPSSKGTEQAMGRLAHRLAF